MARHTATWPVFLLGWGLAVATSCGCSSLQTQPAADLNEQISAAAQPPRGEVIVELRSGSKRDHLKAPLRETMFLQDALEGSGAVKRFSRMNVVLVRAVAGGQKLRLDAKFDPATRRVEDAANYALHPGDLIEVTEDTSTLLDRTITSVLDTLGPITHDYPR